MALEDYIAVKPKFARYVPHTAGRYQKKRFRKAQCPIVERWAPLQAQTEVVGSIAFSCLAYDRETTGAVAASGGPLLTCHTAHRELPDWPYCPMVIDTIAASAAWLLCCQICLSGSQKQRQT